jgi:hypothetical protein
MKQRPFQPMMAGFVVATCLFTAKAFAQDCPEAQEEFPRITFFNQASVDCWVGEDYVDDGLTVSRALASVVTGQRQIAAYKFVGATTTAYAVGTDANLAIVCEANDTSGNNEYGRPGNCPSTVTFIYSVSGSGYSDLLAEEVHR